jgi:hypothetical protein
LIYLAESNAILSSSESISLFITLVALATEASLSQFTHSSISLFLDKKSFHVDSLIQALAHAWESDIHILYQASSISIDFSSTTCHGNLAYISAKIGSSLSTTALRFRLVTSTTIIYIKMEYPQYLFQLLLA